MYVTACFVLVLQHMWLILIPIPEINLTTNSDNNAVDGHNIFCTDRYLEGPCYSTTTTAIHVDPYL